MGTTSYLREAGETGMGDRAAEGGPDLAAVDPFAQAAEHDVRGIEVARDNFGRVRAGGIKTAARQKSVDTARSLGGRESAARDRVLSDSRRARQSQRC